MIIALLIVDESNNYEYFCHKYKTSNNIKNRFRNISINFENLKSKKFYTEKNIKKLIYLLKSKNDVRDLLLFSLFTNSKTEILDIEKLMDYLNTCKIPKFPISGDYLKKYGYKTGQSLGQKLKSLEEKWVENNFVMEEKWIRNL